MIRPAPIIATINLPYESEMSGDTEIRTISHELINSIVTDWRKAHKHHIVMNVGFAFDSGKPMLNIFGCKVKVASNAK